MRRNPRQDFIKTKVVTWPSLQVAVRENPKAGYNVSSIQDTQKSRENISIGRKLHQSYGCLNRWS